MEPTVVAEVADGNILEVLGGYITGLFGLVGQVFNGVWNLPMEIGKITIACSFLGLAISLYNRFIRRH